MTCVKAPPGAAGQTAGVTQLISSPALAGAAPQAAAPPARCYHCGEPLDPRHPVQSRLDGTLRSFCCAGCETVAHAIHAGGLGGYYRHRAEGGGPPAAAPDDGELQAYDLPAVQAQYVREVDADTREATLAVDGLRCAACVWLCEQHLSRQPGVTLVRINYATGRARVRWQAGASSLARVLGEFARIGYHAVPFEPSAQARGAARERRGLLLRMAVAMLAMMQIMMYAWPVYAHEAEIDPGQLALLRWAGLVLTLPVVLYSAAPIFAGAWRSLRLRRPGMDLPVAIGVLAAFAASAAATVAGHGEVYFDSVSMFVALLLGARYLELAARHDAWRGVPAASMQLPAVCARAEGWPAAREVRTVARVQLAPGDVVRVLPGEAVPADGVLLEGGAELDESLLTGESRPAVRQAGDALMAGSHNCATALWMRVTATGADTRLAAIVQALDRALEDKPRLAQAADRVASVFVAALMALALAAGLVWWWLEPARALPVAIAVLVASCPCALSLATPAALAAATASLARRGVLVVRGHAIETLAQVTDVVLDKTGTLTLGRFSLRQVQALGPLPAADCLRLAAELEGASSHPIARALIAAAQALPGCGTAGDSTGLRAATIGRDHDGGLGIDGVGPAGEPRYLPGCGLEARRAGCTLRLGSRAFVRALVPAGAEAAFDTRFPRLAAGGSHPGADAESQSGDTCVWLGDEHGPLARFVLGDTLRPEAEALVAGLAARGLKVHLVSGDDAATVHYWATRLGIANAVGNAGPEDKKRYAAALQQAGAVALAVGDGINDAPLLAQAQVSLAVGGGAALARASADAILAADGVAGVAQAIDTARRARAVIRQNLGWALAYNLTAVPLAAAGLVPPWLSAIGMSLSSLLVVGNAWRLGR
ncbi:heavy metal translocating P-type ATPase [Pigmentiphaga soli]|uniref:Heavy metal translocating P-type ATPase n=1 Tax=Pigmentiphaga soli TaxID=1007095 RepID=A0ABP8HFQ6_9BURK